MNTRNWNDDWRTYQPEHSTWLATTKLEITTNFATDTTCIIPTTAKKPENGKTKWSFDAKNLPDNLAEKIRDQTVTLGWQGSGTFLCTVESTNFILVPTSSLDVSPSQKARQIGLDAAHATKSFAINTLTFCSGNHVAALDIYDGYTQGTYSLKTFKGSKGKDKDTPAKSTLPKTLAFFDSSITQADLDRACAFAQALTITKWVEDAPPNWLTPARFAAIAEGLAADSGFSCTVRGRAEIEKMGMGCFASVACGSRLEPKMIVCEIPGEDTSKTIALIGKGITFDSGGISLKGSGGMGEMKYDMCGGASVLGSAFFLSKVKPKTNVVCIIGAAENMPGEEATRPSDVVTAFDKQTVEILNTDAEGRLVLCDLLAFATKTYNPVLTVDIATLTGAVLVALGSFGAAVISNKQEVADYVVGVSRKIGEPTWQLPLWPEVAKELRSDVADLKNITAASVKAGTITAGQFLREFVGQNKWAHIDIAGTGWNCRSTGYPSNGGSGYGVRLLSQICLQHESS